MFTLLNQCFMVISFASISVQYNNNNLNSDLPDWQKSAISKLPEPYQQCAGSVVAYDKGRNMIWIIGGTGKCQNRIISFDVAKWNQTDAFEDQYDVIPYNIYGYGQAYTQINDKLYIIDPNSGNTFIIYDIPSNEFKDKFDNTGIDVSDVTFPVTVGDTACLASSNMYLFVTGGRRGGDQYGEILNTTQIYHIPENKWITSEDGGVRAMRESRYHHTCLITNPNPFGYPTTTKAKSLYLYVIGGNNGTGYLDSIHRLYVGDMGGIQREFWERLDVKLGKPRMQLRASYDPAQDLIYVVGGMNMGKTLSVHDMVDIINVTMEDRNAITMADADRIVYTLSATALILVDETLYAFGGGKGVNPFYGDCWQYCRLSGNYYYNEDTGNIHVNITMLTIYGIGALLIFVLLLTVIWNCFKKCPRRIRKYSWISVVSGNNIWNGTDGNSLWNGADVPRYTEVYENPDSSIGDYPHDHISSSSQELGWGTSK